MNLLEKFFKLSTPIEIIEAIATYDFRAEYIQEEYPKTRECIQKGCEKTCEAKGVEFHSDLLLSDDPIDKYVAYKVLTNVKKGFDADNSLGTCRLMGEVYRKLWAATVKYSNFMAIKSFVNEDEKIVLFGGDVYNSLQTSIGLSKCECIRLYVKEPAKLKQILANLQDVMKVSHVLGNFGLVPAYYNAYRGTNRGKIRETNEAIEDYLDRSLIELQNNGFNSLDELIKYSNNSEKTSDLEKFTNEKKSQYTDFVPEDYNKYINMMFLWDMHVSETQVRNISSSIKTWNEVTSAFIKRRSLFMAMMLYFACERGEVYMEMLERIIDAKSILSYESVFVLLGDVEGLTESDLSILEEIKEKILEIKIDSDKEGNRE